MLRKSAIVISVLVGLVVGGSIVWQLSQWGEGPGEPDTRGAPEPGAFNPDEADREINFRRIGEGEDYFIQQPDPETGRVLREFRYDKLDPEAEGRFNVANPEARLYVDPERVVRMTAQSGFIVAPDRMPEQGRFSDGVRIELFAAEPGEQPAIGPDSPDRLFTIELEEANFNTMLGKIDAQGPVTLVSEQTRFKGRGLTLVYDELHQRIDYMRIEAGEYLEYQPAAGGPIEPTPGPGAGDAAADEATGGAEATGPAEGATAEADDAAQYYEARFEREVKLRYEGRQIDADVLEATFALRRGRREAATQRDGAAGETLRGAAPETAGRAGAETATPTGTEPAETAAASGEGGAGDAEDGASGERMTLHWSGPLTLEPLAGGPGRLKSVDDALLVFEGGPVKLRDGEGARLVGERAEYHRANGVVSASGSTKYPLRVTAPTLGELSAVSVELSLQTGEGKLWGAGTIRAGEDAAAAGGGGLPEGFAIRWTDYVALELTAAGESPEGLKRATFVGDVEVDDPRFTMAGHRLGVQFAPDEAGERRRLSGVEAEVARPGGAERVRFASRQGAATAERFVLRTTEHRGRTIPAHLKARGQVRMTDQERSIAADVLDADFRPLDPEEIEGGPAAGRAGEAEAMRIGEGEAAFAIGHVEAAGAVELGDGSGSRVTAAKLEADGEAETIELWGEPLVRVEQAGSTLEAPRLTVREGGALATATGEGRFTYERRAGDGAVGAGGEGAGVDTKEDRAKPEAGERLDVRWTGEMRFDDAADVLRVEGDVVADHADRPDRANRLEADVLTLELIRKPPDGTADEADGSSKPLAERPLLEKLVAERNVVVMSTRWASAERKQVEGRLRISGPRLTFDNAIEQVEVEGAGSMLIEDYSEATGRRKLADTRLSGRGKTLFTWLGKLLLDGADSDVIIERGANMTHKPAGEDRVVDLQAHRLVADMAGMGGLQGLGAGAFEDLKIDHLLADRNVQLRDEERVVTADRIRYDGAKRVVLLEAAEGEQVEVVRLDEPRPIKAARIRWDLDKDRLEVLEGRY